MSDYRPGPPPPELSPGERKFRIFMWGLGLCLLALLLTAVYGLVLAFLPAGPNERAKEGGPAPAPQPAVPPRAWFPAERDVPMSAQALRQERAATAEAFTVVDEFGTFTESAHPILASIDGQTHVTLKHLWIPGVEITVPVTELKLVNPGAQQTKFGACVGRTALKYGRAGTRNRVFFRYPSIACAAFTAWCYRTCGKPGMSFSATTSYHQLRKRGARVVASRVSTRYAAYYKWYKPGDALFFHKGSRFGHTEIVVGHGLTSGTSSSMLRIGVRRIGNRGYSLMTVVRP